MNLFSILFVLFFLVPLIEIFLLIQVGSIIGAGLTIFSVVFTAVVGAFLVRSQGMTTFQRFQTKLANGEAPTQEIVDGFCLFIAGALLMTPGFFTDTIGFILLIPALRRIIHAKLNSSSTSTIFRTNVAMNKNVYSKTSQTIDAEYKKIDE